MAAYCQVYDSRHLQADCQDPGSAPEPYTLGNRVWATFTFFDWVVMLCGWKGNRRSGVALAMRHRLQWTHGR